MDKVIQKLERIVSLIRAAQTKRLEDDPDVLQDIRFALLHILKDLDPRLEIVILKDLFTDEQIREQFFKYYTPDFFGNEDNKTVLRIVLFELLWGTPPKPIQQRKAREKDLNRNVQSYTFDEKRWTISRAKKWLRKYNKRWTSVYSEWKSVKEDEKPQKYHRFEVEKPMRFGKSWWYYLGNGIYAVIQKKKK